jgi:hypothetical protein
MPNGPVGRKLQHSEVHQQKATPASEMAFHVELGLCGDYITSVQWVQDGCKVNQSAGITTPWSDSTQNSSVSGYSAAPGHISHRSEGGRTEMWPLRAAGLVNDLWRCDERLLWHLFALGPSCHGQY